MPKSSHPNPEIRRVITARLVMLCALAALLPSCANNADRKAVTTSASRPTLAGTTTPLPGTVAPAARVVPAPITPPIAGVAPVVPAPVVTSSSGIKPASGTATTDGIWYNSVPVNGPFIAITFDDGPHATNTPRLLNILRDEGVKATFFMVGQNVAAYPDIVRRMAADGHELANHSWNHKSFLTLSPEGLESSLKKTHDAILAATGVRARVMRPPYGAFNKLLAAQTFRNFGYKTIIWDVDPLDWKNRSASVVTQRIVSTTKSGSIILAHDIHATTVDAMPGTIRQLKSAGYRFVTVSQLIAIGNRERLSAIEKQRALETSSKLAKLVPSKPTVAPAPYQMPSLARRLPAAPTAPDLSNYTIAAPIRATPPKKLQANGY